MSAIGYSSAAISLPITTPSLVYQDTFSDWVYNSEVSSACGGYYQVPHFNPSSLNTEEAPTDISANYSSLSSTGNSMLSGNVLIERPDFRLTAERISYYRDPQTKKVEYANAEGNILVEEPEHRFFGEAASINLLKNDLTIKDSQFRLYSAHARGTASEIYTEKDKPIYLSDVTYTTCAPDSNVWEVRASSVSLDEPNNKGVARNAWIYIKDVPIAYTPYLTFPLTKERKSGLLPPTYGTSNISGLEFAVPYYFNIAPNYDATTTAHWYSYRGWQAQGEFRYLLNNKNRGTLYAEWVPDDRAFNHFREDNLEGFPPANDPRTEALESANSNRQAVFWEQQGLISSQWIYNINWEFVSDDNYLSDLSPPYFDLNNRTLERELETEFYTENWAWYGRALDYQNLQPFDASIQQESYNVLPQVFADVEYDLGNTGLHYGFLGEASVFTHNNELFTHEPVTQGERYGLSPEAGWEWRRAYGYAKPRVQLFYTAYELDLGTEDELIDDPSNPTRTLPIVDVDTGLFFDRSFNFLGSNFSQTLEPRLFYLYVPNKNQNDLPNFDSELMEFNYNQLFRINRFSGFDRIGDANQLSYAATTRFINTQTGAERSRFSIGQIVYFDDRHVSICDTDAFTQCIDTEDPTNTQEFSPIVAEMYYYFTQNWSGLIETQWNPSDVSQLEQQRVQVNYRDDEGRMFNLGYSFIYQGNPVSDASPGSSQNNLDQIDGAFGWQILPQWKVLAGIEYDITNNFSVENFAGVEYENCCWAIRVGAQKYLTINSSEDYQQFDEQYFIQFSLKGLASIGNSPGGLFADELAGYSDTFGTRY